MGRDLPSGTVSFLFTDVEGSTRLLRELGAEEVCGRVGGASAGAAGCARLDNFPLALELAAARVRVVSPEQLLQRLSQRLDLLKAGRGVDPRQQTLRAAIE